MESCEADAGAGCLDRFREAKSTPVTSARITVTFFCSSSSWRIGAAISDGARTAVATCRAGLEDMMVAPIDQDDVRVGMFQRASRGDPGKAAADNHDLLAPRAGRARCGRASPAARAIASQGNFSGSRPNLQGLAHDSHFSGAVTICRFRGNLMSPEPSRVGRFGWRDADAHTAR